ncbi:hypothetical protein, partial [Phocaeicola vulgatus]|uniref:hypothetical protein n=1 Tax=Phocaeicola vulgatus TaxID=821 RepID=UPI001F19A914
GYPHPVSGRFPYGHELPAVGKDDAAVKDGFPVLLPERGGADPRFSHPFQKGGRIRFDPLPPENRPPVSAGEFKV